MWACYAIALIPVFVGAVLWVSSRRITFGEWMRGSIVGLVVAGGFHIYTLKFPALDAHMRSGKVINAVHRPERQTRQRKGAETKRYDEAWYVTVAVGDREERFAISEEEFEDFREQFGATELVAVRAEGEFVGDSNNYVAVNHNDVFIPAYTMRPFENRARVDRSVLSSAEPPEGSRLFDHPTEMSKAKLMAFFAVQIVVMADSSECVPKELQFFDWRKSERLLGHAAKDYSVEEWDRLNAELAPGTNVNLIMIGFDGESTLAHWQEAKWLGGKKNDLVLCYGSSTSSGKPAWTYCFGPTEDELVKRNLESLLLDNPPGDALLAKIKSEVSANYQPKELPALGYFEVPPPPSAIPTLILVMVVVQGGYWLRAYANRNRRAAIGEAELQDVADEEAREWMDIRENSVKDRIAERLTHLNDPTDIDELTRELLSGKEAYTACLALQRCNGPEAVTSLIVAMSSEKESVREMAADWLDDNAPPPSTCPEAKAAVPALIERLTHRDPNARKAARAVLDKIDPDWPQTAEARSGVDSMLQAIRTGEATDSVIDGLGARGEAVVDPLLAILADGESAAQTAAIRALGRTGCSRVVETLLKHLEQDDNALRNAAIDGFAMFGPALREAAGSLPIYESMLAAFESSEKPVQLQLIEAFGWLGDESAVDTIATFLQGTSWSVRAAAARALGHLGSPKALPCLLACADDNEDAAAIAAIGAIGDDTTTDRILGLLDRHPDTGARFTDACVRVLGQYESAAGRQFIEKTARDYQHASNELAIMYAKRFKSGRPRPEWSKKQRPRPGTQ